MNILKTAKQYIFAVVASAASLAAVSCDDSFFDNEGDCEVSHIIKFSYEQNLKWADAFASEVRSVNLYVFDKRGVFVREYTGRGDELANPDYHIVLDLPADTYRFVAWCGLDNGAETESFKVPQPVPGVTRIEELTCELNTLKSSQAAGSAQAEAERRAGYSDERLQFLYYGYLEDTLVDSHDGKRYEHIVYLTKDTNHIRIILHDTTGEDMNKDDFEIRIEDANAFMEYDNSLRDTGTVTYAPWSQVTDEIGIVDVTSGKLTMQPDDGVVADFTLGRMVESHRNDMMLTIVNSRTKDKILQIPIIQLALLNKGYYELAYNRTIGEQEFLDREEDYVFTFFLVGGKWVDSVIWIHSWRVVWHDQELGE